MTHGTGLSRLAPALNVDHDVKGHFVVGQLERLADHHAAGLTGEELVDGLVVDRELAGALLDEYARDGTLAPAGTVVIVADHGEPYSSRGFGCCAACGWEEPA